ncbi:MAG: hypothetical protein ACRDOO_14665 [Actinomadura sp.]
MRYLTEGFALGALGRGKPIAQFLGPRADADPAVVQWVEIRPRGGEFEVVLNAVHDVGGEHFLDLWEFPLDDPEEDGLGRVLAGADSALGAMKEAEEQTPAVRHRWVNLGVVQDEYRDYIRAGRPLSWPTG